MTWLPRLVFLAFFVLVALSAGCSDDAGCPGGCAEGESCVNSQCVPNSRVCPDGCADDEICVNGTCVSDALQCADVGETCDPSRPVNQGFYCIDVDGSGPAGAQCMERCGTGSTCDPGALCFFVQSSTDPLCTSDSDCTDGRSCQSGVCLDSVCRLSECEGFIDGISDCSTFGFAEGATCVDLGNDAEYCFPAGTKAEGGECVDLSDALDLNTFEDTCQSGLGCVDGTCRVACNTTDDCAGDQTCLLAEDDFFSEGVGFCAQECQPFEEGSCSAAETCLPLGGDDGLCVAAGETEAFEPCTPGLRECVDGTLCIQLQTSNANTGVSQVARCMPSCDVRAGLAGADGSVGEAEQAQRDATCPNPPAAPAGLQFVHLSASVGAVDIYVDGTTTPLVSRLAYGTRSAAGATDYFELDAGSTNYRVLPTGAPSTDPELFEATLALRTGQGTTVYLIPVVGANDQLVAQVVAADVITDPTPRASIRVAQFSPDAPPVDVIAVPVGDDLSTPGNQQPLATGLSLGMTSVTAIDAGDWDLLVFNQGDPRTDRGTALLQLTATLIGIHELYVAGTVDATDLAPLGLELLNHQSVFEVADQGPTYSCVDLDNGVFGYCQQRCEGPEDFGAGACRGSNTGCTPQFINGPDVWAAVCGPVGGLELDAPCNPFAGYGECSEGLYCLEYGNTAIGFNITNRGRCTPLCVQDDPMNATLSCDAGLSCQSIGFDDGFTIGQCGYSCTPDTSYSDTMCPVGLAACLPVASLQEDVSNPDAPPLVRQEDTYCSASGGLPVGEQCSGADCAPGAECLYARGPASGFINTLLSPYVGTVGQSPVCTVQCDPFDGDGTDVVCAPGETCLFNFPFSAEVGHCAPITQMAPVDGSCSNPGEACGDGAICVDNGGQLTCLQFCQYDGGDGMGGLTRETCASGFECTPLVSDIGLCRQPG